MSDPNFEALLAEHNQAFVDAEEYGNDWMPPDGEYVAVLTGLKKGVMVKKGVQIAYWRLTGRIEDVADGQLNGREFLVGWYKATAMGVLKTNVRALNRGLAVGSLTDANKILDSSIGQVIRVRVTTTPEDEDGRTFRNCRILEVIDVAATEAQVQPPQG